MRHKVGSSGTRPRSGIAHAAAANPPMTRTPSPPIIMSPSRVGIAAASAVKISGADRCKVFRSEKLVPKPPR